MEVILCLDQLGHLAQNGPSFLGFSNTKTLRLGKLWAETQKPRSGGFGILPSDSECSWVMSISRAFQDCNCSKSTSIVLLLQWLHVNLAVRSVVAEVIWRARHSSRCGGVVWQSIISLHSEQEQHEHIEHVEHANSEVKSISLEDEVSVQTTQENYRGAEISPQSQSRQSPEPSESGSAVIVTTPLAILQERLKFYPKMSPEWHAAWRITLDSAEKFCSEVGMCRWIWIHWSYVLLSCTELRMLCTVARSHQSQFDSRRWSSTVNHFGWFKFFSDWIAKTAVKELLSSYQLLLRLSFELPGNMRINTVQNSAKYQWINWINSWEPD